MEDTILFDGTVFWVSIAISARILVIWFLMLSASQNLQSLWIDIMIDDAEGLRKKSSEVLEAFLKAYRSMKNLIERRQAVWIFLQIWAHQTDKVSENKSFSQY